MLDAPESQEKQADAGATKKREIEAVIQQEQTHEPDEVRTQQSTTTTGTSRAEAVSSLGSTETNKRPRMEIKKKL